MLAVSLSTLELESRYEASVGGGAGCSFRFCTLGIGTLLGCTGLTNRFDLGPAKPSSSLILCGSCFAIITGVGLERVPNSLSFVTEARLPLSLFSFPELVRVVRSFGVRAGGDDMDPAKEVVELLLKLSVK